MRLILTVDRTETQVIHLLTLEEWGTGPFRALTHTCTITAGLRICIYKSPKPPYIKAKPMRWSFTRIFVSLCTSLRHFKKKKKKRLIFDGNTTDFKIFSVRTNDMTYYFSKPHVRNARERLIP